MNKRKIVLVGKSCTGKDTIAELLKELGFKKPVSHTSRPKRDYEVNGQHYHFISREEFEQMKVGHKFIETDEFNGWYYGITEDEFKGSDLFILTPRGLKQICKTYHLKELLIIYVEASVCLRKQRNDERADTHDSIERRWMNDDIDFENMEQWGENWAMKVSVQDTNAFADFIKAIVETYGHKQKFDVQLRFPEDMHIDFQETDEGHKQVMILDNMKKWLSIPGNMASLMNTGEFSSFKDI